MTTHLALKAHRRQELPEEFRGDDVRYPEELVDHFLRQFTAQSDVVFDPFMGFGTTLICAERLGRIGFGIEFDEKRWCYAQSQLQHPERALHGDSMQLNKLNLPQFDFSITSPPYMGRHHQENPFTAYTTEGAYHQYLNDIESIYRQIALKMNPGARAIVEVANLKHEDGTITTLAWDIAGRLSNVLQFEGEIIVTWDPTYGYGYDHSYCLIYAKL